MVNITFSWYEPNEHEWKHGKSEACIKRVAELEAKQAALSNDDPWRFDLHQEIAALKSGRKTMR